MKAIHGYDGGTNRSRGGVHGGRSRGTTKPRTAAAASVDDGGEVGGRRSFWRQRKRRQRGVRSGGVRGRRSRGRRPAQLLGTTRATAPRGTRSSEVDGSDLSLQSRIRAIQFISNRESSKSETNQSHGRPISAQWLATPYP